MVRISSIYILLSSILILFPGQLISLGLGEIEVNSALNQPLNAQINLISASVDETEEMQVKLAPVSIFDRVGIPRPYFLTQLKFTPVSLPGGAAIRVTSKDPVREPFLTFLVEITWPKGKLLREYTVLLDPPEFAQQQAPEIVKPVTTSETQEQIVEAKPVVAANVATQTEIITEPEAKIITEPEDDLEAIREQMDRALGINDVEVVEVEPISEELTAEKQEAADSKIFSESEVVAQAHDGSVVVGSGDTLYSIAKSANQSGSMSVNQMMLAIQQANPDAFVQNNVNMLKKGAVLRIPEAGNLQIVSVVDARQKILQQNALWREYQGKMSEVEATNIDAPELVNEKSDVSKESRQELKETVKKPETAKQDLHILAAEDGSQSEGNTQVAEGAELKQLQNEVTLTKELAESRAKEVQELNRRVEALESMLDKKEKILNIQSQQLKDLQDQLNLEVDKAVVAENLLKEKAAKEEAKSEVKEIKKPIVEPLPEFTEPVVAEQVVSKPRLEPLPDWDSLPDVESIKDEEVAEAKPKQKTTEVKSEIKQDEMLKEPEADLGFISRMVGFLASLKIHAQKAGIGLGVLAALLGLFLWQKKRSVKTIELAGIGEMPLDVGEDDEHFDDILDETIIAPQRNTEAEVSEDDLGAMEDQGLDEDTGTSSASEPSSDDGFGEDVLVEADVYISYGLYQQAQDLLTDAIAIEPDNNEYKAKLAEVYFNKEDQQEFEQYASKIKDEVGESSSEWQNIIAMGKKLSPSNALFAGSVSTDVAAKAEMDKPKEVDVDIGLETVIDNQASDENIEDAIIDNDVSTEDNGLDFNIDDSVVEDDSVVNKIMEANETSDILNFEVDDLSDDKIVDDVSADLDAIPSSLDETASIDDLTKELEQIGMQTTLDNLKPLDIDEDEFDIAGSMVETVAMQDNDLDGDTAILPADPEETAVYAPNSSVDSSSDDDTEQLDISNMDTEQFDVGNIETEFLDPAEQTIAETRTDLEELGPPSLIEEVGTKLDLAQAFVDMGDSNAAKETLIEVIDEGDESQIKAAKELMDKLGS